MCGSLDWSMETCRYSEVALKKMHTAQCLQFAKMMGLKRKRIEGVFENWIDWNKRRFRTAAKVIQQNEVDIRGIVSAKRQAWAAHIARFGADGREMHLIKLLLNWRPLEWWRLQQYSLQNGLSNFRHRGQYTPRRWEEQFTFSQ